jgi:hypothetical protein
MKKKIFLAANLTRKVLSSKITLLCVNYKQQFLVFVKMFDRFPRRLDLHEKRVPMK